MPEVRPPGDLYLPSAAAPAAWGRCWGLTYESRQRRNYKAGRSFLPGCSLGALAHWETWSARERRAEAAALCAAVLRASILIPGRHGWPS